MLTVANGTNVIQENQYNHEGIRISRTEGNTERKYLYDNGSVAYTLDDSTLSGVNVLGGYQNVIGTYRGAHYYVYNKAVQGSTESITNSSFDPKAAYKFSDFDEVTELLETIDNEICYTDAVYDDTTGLYYMNARYYDPENGRFISQDSYRGELEDAGQWHLYAYCANNPVNHTDPSGHAYSAKKAANYALKWALYRNSEYPAYISDCTNFVSQCAIAGGAVQNPEEVASDVANTVQTTSQWYCQWVKNEGSGGRRGSYSWKVSTSWMRVGDFYSYWKNYGGASTWTFTKAKYKNNYKKLYDKIKLGDIVQLKKTKDGDWYHSIIISKKFRGNWCYASHTYDRRMKNVSALKGHYGFRIIRIK